MFFSTHACAVHELDPDADAVVAVSKLMRMRTAQYNILIEADAEFRNLELAIGKLFRSSCMCSAQYTNLIDADANRQ